MVTQTAILCTACRRETPSTHTNGECPPCFSYRVDLLEAGIITRLFDDITAESAELERRAGEAEWLDMATTYGNPEHVLAVA